MVGQRFSCWFLFRDSCLVRKNKINHSISDILLEVSIKEYAPAWGLPLSLLVKYKISPSILLSFSGYNKGSVLTHLFSWHRILTADWNANESVSWVEPVLVVYRGLKNAPTVGIEPVTSWSLSVHHYFTVTFIKSLFAVRDWAVNVSIALWFRQIRERLIPVAFMGRR